MNLTGIGELYCKQNEFKVIPQYSHGPFEMGFYRCFCNIHLFGNIFYFFLFNNMLHDHFPLLVRKKFQNLLQPFMHIFINIRFFNI